MTKDAHAPSPMRTLGSIWAWAVIALVVIFGFFIQAALAVVTLPFDRRRYVVGRFFRLMAVAAATLNPLWRFRIHGPVRRPAGKAVVISNHASQADIFLISHLPWEMKWLVKSQLRRVPLFGWSLWIAGDIPVHRGEKESAHAAMGRCAQWLDRGVPIMIFPEGTRSMDGHLLPFKDGAFRLAIESGTDLLPLAVHGTHDALPKRSWRFGSAEARVMVGEPIATTGMTLANLETLKSRARSQIESMMDELSRATASAVGQAA